jgi:hypothetical protein
MLMTFHVCQALAAVFQHEAEEGGAMELQFVRYEGLGRRLGRGLQQAGNVVGSVPHGEFMCKAADFGVVHTSDFEDDALAKLGAMQFEDVPRQDFVRHRMRGDAQGFVSVGDSIAFGQVAGVLLHV